MARPAKQGMDYFPHDTDAASDEKVESLRILYGNDGYAFYFILLERIYRTADFELDVSDAETRQILARKVEVTPQKFEDMLASAVKRGCFDAAAYAERGVLTSTGIKKRADAVVSKRQKMASAYSNRVSAAETTPETQQKEGFPSREKESKGKERKEESTTTSLRSARPAKQEPEHFAAFWQAYPRKESRATALKAFEKLNPEEQAAASGWARDFFARRTDWLGPNGEDYRPHPSTWLNKQRWNDLTEITITPPPVAQPQQPYGNAQRHAVGQQHGFVNHEKRDFAFAKLKELGL